MDGSLAIAAFAALAQDTRLAAFRHLTAAGPAGVPAGELARSLGVPHNTLSFHLAVLARAGLVSARRDSRSVFYAVAPEGVRALLGYLLEECCGGRPDLCAPAATCPTETAR